MKRSLYLLGAIFLSGCNFTSDALDKEREWRSQDIHNYRFVYTVSCFCGFTGPNPAVITVIDDEVAKVEYLAPSQNGGTVSTNGYPTIDGIFALLAAARARNPDKIDVDYDSQYGFPRSIEVDYVKNAADDEIEYKVENFTILTSGG